MQWLLVSKTASSWIEDMQNNLKEAGVLVDRHGVWIVTKDHIISSPSAYAAVVFARRANGWIE
jgi:hypothetical protein